VEAAAASKDPGYKATFGMVGNPLLDGLNAILNHSILSPSLHLGVVRLLPKVPGMPRASQLKLITLHNTDYKLLTKMFVASLLPLLPSVLQVTQLCSVLGSSILDGPASILSAAEFLQRHQHPGFLLSLNFFHTYDIGFGLVSEAGGITLHREALASFLLHGVSLSSPSSFPSARGTPLPPSSLSFIWSPSLVQLEAVLSGLRIANIREASFGYFDDVQVLWDDLQDIVRVDLACRDFEFKIVQFCDFCGYQKGRPTILFSPLSSVSVFASRIRDLASGMDKNQDPGSRIWDKHPRSATLLAHAMQPTS
jgi:hypothetical protein